MKSNTLQKWEEFLNAMTRNDDMLIDLSSATELPGELAADVKIPDGLVKEIQIVLGAISNLNVNLKFDLGKDADIKLKIIGDFQVSSEKKIDVSVSSIQSSASLFSFDGRFVCSGDVKFDLNTKGNVGAKSNGASCLYDSKVLRIGNQPKIKGFPVLEVENKNVEANHGLSIGPIPQDVLAFMESRGIDKAEAEKIYASGFLRGL